MNRFNLGGPTFNAAYLTKYIGEEYETVLVGGQKDETEADSEFILNDLGIEPVRIAEMHRPVNPILDFQAYTKIKKLIREFKPHIVHTHASKAGALGRRAAAYLKVPVVVHTFHGHVFDAYFNRMQSNFYVRLERHLAAKTDAIVTLSENQRFDISEKFKICEPEKVSIIPLGFDLTRFNEDREMKRHSFRQKYQIAEDEIAIGIIGRLVPVKNHSLFVRALSDIIRNSEKKIRAFIVGDGESRNQIMKELAGLKISYSLPGQQAAQVMFTLWEKDIDYVNAGMDIVVLTSLNEGTPVSLIEAQASGTPIVTTNVGGISNIVIDKKTALVADSDDKFIHSLGRLVQDDNLRNSLAGNGWDFVKDKFHYTRLISEMSGLYQSLLQKKNAIGHNSH